MWGTKTKEERAEEAEETRKEMSVVERRLLNAERRLNALSSELAVIRRKPNGEAV